MRKMRIPIIPAWCQGLPDTTMLYTCDILEFFQYNVADKNNNSTQANSYLNGGYLPKPKELPFKSKGTMRRRDKMWLLGDIKILRAKMLAEQDCEIL